MSKQTFTTGQVLTAAQLNSLQANDYNQTVSVKTASYVLVAADKGTRIEFNTSGSVTCTVNSGLFDAGDTLVIQNRGAGTATVTAGTATVNTGGSLVVNQYESGTLYFISASAALWFGSNPGDITAVTAGTGISGGGTSGAVTITNSMATEITAAGDIIVGTGSGTFDNLPIGTTGQVLTADTTVSPYKVKWATAASGSTFAGCSLQKTSTQSIANTTYVTLTFDTENYDSNSYHDNVTNNTRITIPSGKAGKYLFSGIIDWDSNATGMRTVVLYKNGVEVNTITRGAGLAGGELTKLPYSYVADAAISDYFELQVYQSSGGSLNIRSGSSGTTFQASYLGA